MAFDSDDDFSGTDSDEGFQEDMEALKKACLFAGEDTDDLHPSTSTGDIVSNHVTCTDDVIVTPCGSDADDDEDDDIELVRSIQERFALSTELREPLNLKPLYSIDPRGGSEFDDDDGDDFETLRAIQRRFAAFSDDSVKERKESSLDKSEQVGVTNITSEKESSNNFFVERTNAEEGFPACVDQTTHFSEGCSNDSAARFQTPIEWHDDDSGAENTAVSVKSSSFPESAQAFVDAIKKNRSCQKLIRNKMMQVEARMEELKKLKERVKILKSFQLTCRKRMGRALSQKRDARVQLISLPKQRFSSKVQGKKLSAIHYGPPENSHVASFREALTEFAVSLSRKEWSKEEREKLAKGVKQQFQEMLLQHSVNLRSDQDGCSGESGDLDDTIASIRDLVNKIAPETMRLFLPKVNWDQVASMYLPGRSGAECQSRWLNWEDPLIKHEGWDIVEEKKLLHAVQQKQMSDWIEIAASLGVCRTPFQCLSHYQRSLNASIIRRDWTEEEDIRLCALVETFGESSWQVVASFMEGRTGTQCSNRWIKSLHPARKRSGKWSTDEDKRLKVAVMLFYPKTWRNIGQSVPYRTPIWKKIAQFVPGRTHVQCRERWVNSLDPSLKLDGWTEEEDLKLRSAIDEHGYSWSKVAACVPPRTDNQCRRRWKVLFPNEVPMLQEAKKIHREAFISNFVDREEERPALRPNDLVPTHKLSDKAGCETTSANKKRKRRPRAGRKDTAPRSLLSPRDHEIERILDGEEGFEQDYHDASKNKRPSKLRVRKTKNFAPNDEDPDASASSQVESTIGYGNKYKRRRRTSSLMKKKAKNVAFQESSSSFPNQSPSMTAAEEAESHIRDSRKTNHIMDGRHSIRECDNQLKAIDNQPDTTADFTTLASFISKSRAKRRSLSSAKVAKHPELGQSKTMADNNSSCISGRDGLGKTMAEDCTSSLTKKKAKNVALQESSSSFPNQSSSMTAAEEAESHIRDSRKTNHIMDERHSIRECDNQLKAINNWPETTEDCTSLASFISKSSAKRRSLSSAKVAKHPESGQSKTMADNNSSCIAGRDGLGKTMVEDFTCSNGVSGAEVGDDMPLSLFMSRAKRKH